MIALVDYGAGNLRSVYNALHAAGAHEVTIARDAATIRASDRIVLPGVGAFSAAMQGLQAIPECLDALEQRVRRDAVPFLGICVGMQILADVGEENGDCTGLGWIGGRIQHLSTPPNADVTRARVPHIGWNDIRPTQSHPLLAPGVGYFLHSYHFAKANAADVLATSDHSGAVGAVAASTDTLDSASDGQGALVAAVARDTIVGVQFHPEKSQRYGIAFLEKFLAWKP